MPAQSCPEVFNSRGRVAPVGSSPAPGDSRISVSSTGVNLQAVVASLMQDVKTGVPMGLIMSTRLRQLPLSDPNQLTLFLSEILNYALLENDVENGVDAVAYLNKRKHFASSLPDSLSNILNLFPDHNQLTALLSSLCLSPQLAPQAPSLSLLVVDKLLSWVSPTSNLLKDLERIKMAQRLLTGLSELIAMHSPSGIRLLWKQVRALLIGQTGRAVWREQLLDLLLVINRVRTLDGNGYLVDIVDDCNNIENAVNVKLLRPIDFNVGVEEEESVSLGEPEGGVDDAVQQKLSVASANNAEDAQEVFLTVDEGGEERQDKTREVEGGEVEPTKRNPSEDSEENMISLESALKSDEYLSAKNPEPLSPRYVDTFNDDLEQLRQAVLKKKSQSEASEQDMVSLENALGSKVKLGGEQDLALGILGYLKDSTGEVHPMVDGSLIGRDPQCQLKLSSKTVSRRHAQIIYSEAGGGAALQLFSSNNKVNNTVNGELVQGEVLLKHGDIIQLSKNVLVWHESTKKESDPKYVTCLESTPSLM